MTALRRLGGAVPHLFLGLLYLTALVAPGALEGGFVTWLVRAARLEFFVIHCAGFLMWPWLVREWSPARRAGYALALAAAYTLVLAVLAVVIGGWWPVTVFWGLMGARIVHAAVNPPPADVNAAAEPWAGSVVLFVAVACGVGLGGFTDEAVLFAGAGYFLAHAVSEAGDWWWTRRWIRRRRDVRDGGDKRDGRWGRKR